MIDLVTPANFDFFARYLLAGLIIIWIRANFVIGERSRLTDMIVEAIILSLFNQLTFLLLTSGLAAFAVDLTSRPGFFIEVLLLPVLIGLGLGWGNASGWISTLFRLLSIPAQNVRRAYDFAFVRYEVEGFVIVTYADGTKVHGYFGENSMASNDADRSDLYLERIYDVGDDDQWYEKSPPRGVLLVLEGLRSIEFLEPERTSDEQTAVDRRVSTDKVRRYREGNRSPLCPVTGRFRAFAAVRRVRTKRPDRARKVAQDDFFRLHPQEIGNTQWFSGSSKANSSTSSHGLMTRATRWSGALNAATTPSNTAPS